MEDLSVITFDKDDRNLFQVDDPRLRADALKHSLIPRLLVLMNEIIAVIREIYDIEVLEDSIISQYPNFRTKRNSELNHLYDAAYVGLGGKVVKNKWKGLEKKDGREVQRLPFRFGLELTKYGLSLHFNTDWLKGLDDNSFRKLLDFHVKHEPMVHALCNWSSIKYGIWDMISEKPIAPLREILKYMLTNRRFNVNLGSIQPFHYPISNEDLGLVIDHFTYFYPVYDSYLMIAMDKPIRFNTLVDKMNAAIEESNSICEEPEPEEFLDPSIVAAAAESRVKVMPAIRWQVFQRDEWKCVSCGRSSHHHIILQVDHILPRSKGGSDSLDNLQTLCNECNVGKSNKNDTNLRKHR